MSTYNICFRGVIRKISDFFCMKKAPYLLLCERRSFLHELKRLMARSKYLNIGMIHSSR